VHVGGDGSWRNLLDYWNLAAIYCYEPGYEPFSRLPMARYDGVICANALEQNPEEDIPWILQELVDRAGRFLFASVACFPGRLRLPNGEEARCTVRPPEPGLSPARHARRRDPEDQHRFHERNSLACSPIGAARRIRGFERLRAR
jgi:hypothetical protein